MTDHAPPSFSPGRRWRIGFSVLISILALGAIVAMVNYLSAQRFMRFESPRSAKREISPLTQRVLQTLTNKVRVVVFFNHRNDLYDPVISLLRKYALRSRHLDIEDIDYVRYIGRAKQVLADLNQDPSIETDRIIFSANGRTKVVHEGELSEYANATEAIMRGKEIDRTGFRGEQLFTAAIFSVSDPKPMKAYFLQGHNEHDPANDSENSFDGYAKFARVLQDNNLSLGTVTLNGGEVPKDCELLVIAGALNRVSPSELDAIDKYLQQGGRVLLLFTFDSLDNRTGLERTGFHDLAANWGVEVGQNFIIDGASGRANAQQELIVSEFGSHSVVNPLRRGRLSLGLTRTIGLRRGGVAGADGPQVTELMFTSPNASAARKRSSSSIEISGRPLPIAVALEKGALHGIGSDRGATRMVVVGESLFLGNRMIDREANRDFARNAINWLLSREVLLEGIGPQPIEQYRISMSAREMKTAQWIMLGAAPGSVLFFGWLVWLRRRS